LRSKRSQTPASRGGDHPVFPDSAYNVLPSDPGILRLDKLHRKRQYHQDGGGIPD